VVTSSANPVLYGQPVTFTATVSVAAGTPTGTVVFNDGATTLGSAALNASGVATLTVTTLAAGSHSMTAVYGGDPTVAASTSAAAGQPVNASAATQASVAAVTSSANPAAFGQPVTFTATVSAGAGGTGIPTGTVTFTDGATALGSSALNAAGQATLTISSL